MAAVVFVAFLWQDARSCPPAIAPVLRLRPGCHNQCHRPPCTAACAGPGRRKSPGLAEGGTAVYRLALPMPSSCLHPGALESAACAAVQQRLLDQLGQRRAVLRSAVPQALNGKLPCVLRGAGGVQPCLHQCHRKRRPGALACHAVKPAQTGETLLGQRVFIVQRPQQCRCAGGTRALAEATTRWRKIGTVGGQLGR